MVLRLYLEYFILMIDLLKRYEKYFIFTNKKWKSVLHQILKSFISIMILFNDNKGFHFYY